ncbi:Uncharacterised protein [Mycobacteroides abscessus subsp. abscessus]|nr:Uncharacterised protein [Mycobacteroides abscessus subsp. abscessus]
MTLKPNLYWNPLRSGNWTDTSLTFTPSGAASSCSALTVPLGTDVLRLTETLSMVAVSRPSSHFRSPSARGAGGSVSLPSASRMRSIWTVCADCRVACRLSEGSMITLRRCCVRCASSVRALGCETEQRSKMTAGNRSPADPSAGTVEATEVMSRSSGTTRN